MLGWIAVASMLALALIGPAARSVLAAPEQNDVACNNVKTGADDPDVQITVTATGVTVSWTFEGAPTVVRACVFPSDPSAGGGEGVWDQNPPDASSETFTWADFGLESNPCVSNPDAMFRGSVDITGVANTRKSNTAGCPTLESQPPSNPPSVPASNPPSVPASEPASNPPSVPASNPPSGGVEEETGTPGITPPSTSTDIGSTGSTSNGWVIPILGIALLLSSLLLLTPRRTVRRRR